MEYAIAWIVLAALVALWNVSRGNSFAVGFLLSLLLSPVIGFIIVAVTKANKGNVVKRGLKSGKLKKCPSCSKPNRTSARRCEYCGRIIDNL